MSAERSIASNDNWQVRLVVDFGFSGFGVADEALESGEFDLVREEEFLDDGRLTEDFLIKVFLVECVMDIVESNKRLAPIPPRKLLHEFLPL